MRPTKVLYNGSILTMIFEDGTRRDFDTMDEKQAMFLKRKRNKEQWERANACTISTRCSRQMANTYSMWCAENGTTPYRHLRTYVEKIVETC